MSIVKQIVDLSGGRIDVRSDQLTGTEVKLSLPLENCLSNEGDSTTTITTLAEHEDPVDAVRRRAGRRTINIQGFDAPLGTSYLHAGSLASLRESMVKYCSQWFRLEVLPSSDDADISILDEFAFQNLPPAENRSRMLVVLCENSTRRELYPTTTNSDQIVEFVSKPCGPHRLAKALLNCLDAHDSSPRTMLERVGALGLGPNSGGVSSEDAMIGDLQSSIGFSPAITSLIKTPELKTESENNTAQPKPHRDSGSGGSGGSHSSKSSLSDKVQIINTGEIFSTPITPMILQNMPFAQESRAGDDTPTSWRKPKMLLVEVRVFSLANVHHTNQL
jgi:hypothetical protein